jgi:hypothetical protein
MYRPTVWLRNENDKFHKSLSRPSIIDARAHYWDAARRLKNIVLQHRYHLFKIHISDILSSISV